MFCDYLEGWDGGGAREAPEGGHIRMQIQKDLLEKGLTTHPSILAWEIPGTEELGGLRSMGWQKNSTRLSN